MKQGAISRLIDKVVILSSKVDIISVVPKENTRNTRIGHAQADSIEIGVINFSFPEYV